MTVPRYPDLRFGLPVLSPRIEQAISRFAPDVMHVAAPAALGVGVVLSARRRRVPLVASYHVQYPEYARRYYGLGFALPMVWDILRLIHNRARLNLATSIPMVQELQSHGFSHVKHWRAGVDATRFTPEKRSVEWRSRLSGGHPGATIIICVSRLAIEKEIERLAPAMREMSGVRLALVGDGPARGQLEAAFAGLPVTFMGMLHGDDLAAAYASADLFALPSSTETLGLVALEAMASGLPAVVANRGGLPDLVVDGQTGVLFDPDRPAELVAALSMLCSDDALRATQAVAARAHAERFAWELTTRQLQAYYAHVVERSPLPAAEDFVPEEDTSPTMLVSEA